MPKPAGATPSRGPRHRRALPDPSAGTTPRRPAARRRVAPLLALIALGLGGCATPGPLHLYSTANGARVVHDVAVQPDVARAAPSFLAPGEQLTGFGYDPFTDHFFLRLAPGNHIRVVDRPGRRIKLEYVVKGVPADGGGDLAVSPRDGHMYLVDPAGPVIHVVSRWGKLVRSFRLADRTTPAAADAYDIPRRQLLVLDADDRTVQRYDLHGKPLASMVLSRHVLPSLAYDSVRNEIYAPLPGRSAVGVFDARGRLTRTIAIAPGDRFIDVGPHSFFRMF